MYINQPISWQSSYKRFRYIPSDLQPHICVCLKTTSPCLFLAFTNVHAFNHLHCHRCTCCCYSRYGNSPQYEIHFLNPRFQSWVVGVQELSDVRMGGAFRKIGKIRKHACVNWTSARRPIVIVTGKAYTLLRQGKKHIGLQNVVRVWLT